MNQTNLQFKTLLLLLVVVTVGFFWILLPFYGAVFWAIILGIIFAPMQRRLQLKFGWNRNLTSLCTLMVPTFGPLGTRTSLGCLPRRLQPSCSALSGR